MKKLNKFLGIIAFAAVIVFGFIACPEDEGNDGKAPEELTVAERWGKWVAADSTATLDYSVAADGVCKITVGNVAMPHNSTDGWNIWKVHAMYKYTAKANTNYKYTFEAWTESGSGDRPIQIQYYYSSPSEDPEYLQVYDINFTEERKTYTIRGESIPKGGVQELKFQCANQLGAFYVKITSITEHTPELEYELINDEYNDNHNTYRLVSAVGMRDAVVIHAEYNGKPVTEIGGWAFRETNITGVTIPTSIKSIGWGAFFKCTGLTSVNIPASVTEISGNPFAECTSLTSITVSSSNSYFISEGGILYNIDKTGLLVAPAGISSATIPASVNNIGLYAFEGCRRLTSINIPATVTSIYQGAFQGWTASQTINVPFISMQAANYMWGSSWLDGSNANIVYQAKQLIIQGIFQALMTEFSNSNGYIGLFSVDTTVQQALQMAEDYYQTGNAGAVVAGSDFSEAYTNDAFTIAYLPLFNISTGNPWNGSGSYMIGLLVETYYPNNRRVFWTGPVDFSSANTTITFDTAWEVTLP